MTNNVAPIKLALIAVCLWACCPLHISAADTGITLYARDFGALPNDDKDDREALQLAIDECLRQNATTLRVPPGRYLLKSEAAEQLERDATSGKLGNPQASIFNKHYQYVVGLDFTGVENLLVDAEGVELVCHGWMEPINLTRTRDLTIRGLAIDYHRPPNSAGRVVASTEGCIDVELMEWCPLIEGIRFLRIMVYDPQEKVYVKRGGIQSDEYQHIGPQTLRFKVNGTNPPRVGDILWTLHGFHFRPAILIYQSYNTSLEDVSIHAQPGMGIVGHMSEDITLKRLRVAPKSPDRYVSSNTDATHFASCYGTLRFDECEFTGQGDDATNVHNYYHSVRSMVGNTITSYISNGDLHSQKPDVPRVGDTLAITNARTLAEIGTIAVTRVVHVDPDTYDATYEIEGILPSDADDYYLSNVTALPKVVFRNSEVAAHRARSILLKTRGALIEGNSFHGSTGTAIHIGAEAQWMEGATSQDITIRNNSFSHNGGGDGTIDHASIVAIHVAAPDRNAVGLHQRILIEKNVIRRPGTACLFLISGAEDVLIRGNRLEGSEPAIMRIETSRRVRAHENYGWEEYSTQDGEPQLPRK